jgi:hypothetical protein
MHRWIITLITVVASLGLGGCGSWFYTGQHPSVAYERTPDHMPESIRTGVNSVVILADTTKPILQIGGDYGQYVPTVGEGAAGGVAAGAKVSGAMLAEDPRAIIILPFILPVAMIAGGIGGAAAAKIEQELAEFREGLTDDLVDVGDRPVPGERLVAQMHAYLNSTNSIDSVSVNSDATLTVSVTDISVDTENEDATITTFTTGVLTRNFDQAVLYSETYKYSERDKLRNWTANDNAEWVAYAERARDFIVTEMAADMFETVRLRNVLRPVKSESFTGGWSGRAKSHHPNLSWELFLLGDDPYAFEIDEDKIRFDLRIFDGSRLVYEARRIDGTSHMPDEPLPKCKDLRWSVRPVYQVEGQVRAGDWMQYRSGFDKVWNNDALKTNPVTPAFWQYFAELETRCSS